METRLLVSKREVVLKWYQSGLNWYEVDPGLLASIWVIPNDLCMFPPILSRSVYFLATLSNIFQTKVFKGVPWKSRRPGSGLWRELREKKKRTFQPIYNLSFIFFFITGVLFFYGCDHLIKKWRMTRPGVAERLKFPLARCVARAYPDTS